MHQDSFILIPCPSKTEGELFKLLGAFERTYDSGDTEDRYIIAFACKERHEIQNLVLYCFEKLLHMPPTVENVTHAAILALCSKLLMMRPDGTLPSEETTEFIRKQFNIRVNRTDILFLGGKNPTQGNMELTKLQMEAIMSANK